MARPSRGALGLVTLLALGTLLLLPAVSASLYQFYDGVSDPPPNYPAGGTGVAVFRNEWGAQSFVASGDYTLARVDLWASANSATGANSTLVVTTDRAGGPDMVDPPLATAAASAPDSFGWVSFNVAPNVVLSVGTTYWIVLENSGSSASQGWSWWNTQNETTISSGSGDLSSNSGGAWSAAGGDFALRTFGYVDADVDVAAAVSGPQARAGESVTVTVWFNNTGTTPAGTVWINNTMPSGLAYVSDNALAANGVRVGTANWTFNGVEPGGHSFVIVFSIDSEQANHTFLVDRIELAYTDFRGQPMPASSTTVTVIVSGAVPPTPGAWGPISAVIAAVLAGWVLLVVLWPRGKIEDVFLVDNGGTLMAHLSRTEASRPDHDIFVGMLTAVQDFIRESFSRAGGGNLRHLDFGREKILIRRGDHSYLAVVIRGRVPPTLYRRMARTLGRVEAAYGDVFARQGGDWVRVQDSTEVLETGLFG